MLCLSFADQESVFLDAPGHERIKITVSKNHTKPNKIMLVIEAPKEIKIIREKAKVKV